MSWSGFKKNVGRATTQVMMKTGHVEKTSDREYEVEERRYRTLESASLRLQKEAKGYLDSLRAMTASQMRIAETIDAFYGDSGAKDGVSLSYKQAVEDLDAETVKALDGPYRTTVLEPISRFCAYFPDINECIKKRNHKLLDYDSMRSKVKKLVEKPDKDPSKLPRTEKETEMVNATTLLDECLVRGDCTTTTITQPSSTEMDISPSAGKTGNFKGKDKYTSNIQADEDAVLRSVGLEQSSSAMNWLSGSSTGKDDTFRGKLSQISTPRPKEPTQARYSRNRALERSTSSKSPTEALFGSGPSSVTAISPGTPLQSLPPTRAPSYKTSVQSPFITPTKRRSKNSKLSQDTAQAQPKLDLVPTPFFNPSELEEIMAPLKAEFIERQTNLTTQAKAAYEQLNEQLTNELPQLIDLRVPYLDPSFEALVKIQLRFCAEAYSRMAQVQQYLDATTRDQYANGDLDARVEDVLGQIRELSIAGTV